MTKSNSLRSLKKRRSASSVKNKERRFEKAILPSRQPEELTAETRAEATGSRHEQKPQNEPGGEWFYWWNGSTLTDFYAWCQSSLKEVS